jgi:hypothetical protein
MWKRFTVVTLIAAVGVQAWSAEAAQRRGHTTENAKLITWQAGVYYRAHQEDKPQTEGPRTLSAAACRNERVAFQVAAYAAEGAKDLRVHATPLRGAGEIPAAAWQVRYVDYVETEERGMVGDILSEDPVRDLAKAQVQPIWLTLRVPRETPSGAYQGEVEIRCGDQKAVFPVEVAVLDAVLPDPKDDGFYLDLWQHPGAIARFHQVKMWSEAHWNLIRDYTRALAEAGQNPITACIIHDPWASQTLDPHPSMVEWTRNGDGTLAFDFAVFDRYVALCFEEGFTGPINCYSLAMGPGARLDCPIRYWDAAEGRYGRLECTVGDDTWKGVWQQFFAVFIPHLREKGWLEKTCMAMDEAPEEKMQAVLAAIPAEFKIALAGNYHASLDERIYDYCVAYPGPPPEASQARRARGEITTFYTCCGPLFPNTFTFSPPVESRLLAWNALKMDCDGYLRWAFASWPENPLKSSVWKPWPSGDTFVGYPGPRSSIRFELLKQGIQDFAAYRLAKAKAPDDPRLEEAIQRANAQHNGTKFDVMELDAARALVNDILAGR